MGFFTSRGILLAIAASIAVPCSGKLDTSQPRFATFADENGLDFEVGAGGETKLRGKLGIALPTAVGQATQVTCPPQYRNGECFQYGDYASVVIRDHDEHAHCLRVEWTSSYARRLEDCFYIENDIHWYGGGEAYRQHWPIEQGARLEGPFITSDFIQFPETAYAGVSENYWLLSSGAAIIVDENVPLFFSLNTTRKNELCYIAQDIFPFQERDSLHLSYSVCVGNDAKDVHLKTLIPFYGKPSGLPDERMLIEPFWSTWAQYKENVNQSIVLEYAQRVVDEGFSRTSHIEIDDDWETCYGELEFNPQKFPDPAGMVSQLKEKNFRVTIWVHTFINSNCPSFMTGFNNRFFVADAKIKSAVTWWWQGLYAGVIDFSYIPAVNWYKSRLNRLINDIGIDSFKFDAGEAYWLPTGAVLIGDKETQPNSFSTKYVDAVSSYGGLIEVRVGRRNQAQNIFFRMLDKDSVWGYDNGLRTLIPTLLHFGILGYPFVLPDMIGGNAYNGQSPSKEMFIRWMQANAFMPSVQFSIVPWEYDQETIDITRDVLEFRHQYREEILAAANEAATDGTPINRPMWWVDPADKTLFTIDDQYMLGDTILVAPVVDEATFSRDIYLPQGTWVAQPEGTVYNGPTWIRSYDVPLNKVPFFVKQ